eukprot:CAMPEP_0197080292 /NCGR_PEP_ID=MMETSP1384-20130603/214055_1 /TAXON_ID=29189 /ORGANISM="Ammonia sp." /LENGTH=820 /DNA_ID=CAMNT_0042519175 /DNA_START=37 /DNA_END=2496 /DNA_ORIENTATION=-
MTIRNKLNKQVPPSVTSSTTHSDGASIVIIKDAKTCTQALHQLLSVHPKFVGVDCEWKSNEKGQLHPNKICLLQIAHQELILLIRIHLFSHEIPSELIAFLQNVEIIKCGVGICDDAKKLNRDYNLEMHGCVDLNSINTVYDEDSNQRHFGLKRFALRILNTPMKYKENMNHSEWEQDELNAVQIQYAADDAFVAYKVFEKILQTQYEYDGNQDIKEICFGKMDVHLPGHSNNNSRSKICRPKPIKPLPSTSGGGVDRTVESDQAHGMIECFLPNGDFLSFVPKKCAKLFLRKQWAKKIHLHSIQLLFKPNPIDPGNNDVFNYVRVLTMTHYGCVVCGDEGSQHAAHNNNGDGDSKQDMLFWHYLIPKSHDVFPKSIDHPYRVLLCKKCYGSATKLRTQFLHQFALQAVKEQAEFKYITELYQTRNICWNLKHRKKRHCFTVQQQNEFVQQILAYCNIENREQIVIRPDDFDPDAELDWYHMDNNEDYEVIRSCIQKICAERNRQRKEHNAKYNAALTGFWKERKIEFAEKWRLHFMREMMPKYVNQQLPAFQINVHKLQNKILERKCKHKILDFHGDLLTRTTLTFSTSLLSAMDENDDEKQQAVAVRIRNKSVQLLAEVKQNELVISSDNADKHVKQQSRCWIIWIPFQNIECFDCQCMYYDAGMLRIFHAFPKTYYDLLCERYDGEFASEYMMQYFVPLCNDCWLNASRTQMEFEWHLFEKHDLVQSERTDEEKEEVTLEMCAAQLSQKVHRDRLSVIQQNEFVQRILRYFDIDDEDVCIKEQHCNTEMGADWFYVNEFHYQVIKECISELLEENAW